MMIVEDSRTIAFYNAPYLPDSNFQHRASLQQVYEEGIGRDKPVVFHGKAGTGKTHTAVHLAYDFCTQAQEINKDTFVLWIYAQSVHSILSSFHTIALELGLPVAEEPRDNACQLVADWLAEKVAEVSTSSRAESSTAAESFKSRPYLIVLDGVESLELIDKPLRLSEEFLKYSEPTQKYKSLRTYLSPAKSATNWLITTRSEDVAIAFDSIRVELDDFSLHEAQSLCAQIIGDGVISDAGQILDEKLSMNPMVVAFAASFINHTGITFDEYVNKIHNSITKLSNKSPPIDLPPEFCVGTSQKPNVLAAVVLEPITWLLTNSNYLKEDHCLDAFTKLGLGVGLGGRNIPLWDFVKSPRWEANYEESPTLLILQALSLIRRSRPGFFFVNDLVQQAWWKCNREFAESSIADAQTCINKLFMQMAARGRGIAHEFLPLTEVVLAYPKFNLDELMSLLEERAGYYLSLNFYKEAWRDASSVYEIVQEVYKDEPGSKPVLVSLRHLAQVANNMGKYDVAAKLHRMALDGSRKLSNVDDLRIGCTTDLAMTMGRLGDHKASADLYRQAIEDRKQVYGEDMYVLSYEASLGEHLCYLRQKDEAFALQDRAYTKLKEQYGEKHEQTLSALSNLILTLKAQGKWAEAIEKNQFLLQSYEEMSGMTSWRTLAIVANHATLHYELGNKEESYKLYRRSLDGYTARIGAKHPQTLVVRGIFEDLFRHRLVTV